MRGAADLMDRYKKLIDLIKEGKLSREQLSSLRVNVQNAVDKGDKEAQVVLELANRAMPTDRYFIFMGFCPNADINNRLDIEWRSKGICTFEFYESERQMERFRSIQVGDLVILKKRHEFGRTMRLFGYGRVASLDKSTKNDPMLRMQWSKQSNEIEVPLMACNDTVNIREIEKVEQAMPEKFWKWLEL
jgi:hypothetical protein